MKFIKDLFRKKYLVHIYFKSGTFTKYKMLDITITNTTLGEGNDLRHIVSKMKWETTGEIILFISLDQIECIEAKRVWF